MTQKVHPVGQLFVFGGALRPQTHMGTYGAAPLFRAKKMAKKRQIRPKTGFVTSNQ